MVICPECESDLDIEEDEVDEGEVVSCPECGTDFEVVAVEPLELSRVEDEAIDDEEEVGRRRGRGVAWRMLRRHRGRWIALAGCCSMLLLAATAAAD